MWLGGRTENYRSLGFQEAEWNWVDGSPFSYSNFPSSGMSRQSGNVLTFVNSIGYDGYDSCHAQGCWKMHDKSQNSSISLTAVCQGISKYTSCIIFFLMAFPRYSM